MAKASIMIVEDESIVAEDIRFSLEANGYEVCGVFDSGEEAIRQAGRLQPDLILQDIKLKGELDGTQTAQRIWDQHGIPSVYLTAHSDAATVDRAKWTRPFGYLLKPFEERELCVTVEIALSKRPLAPLLELPAVGLYAELQRMLATNDPALSAGQGESPDDRSTDTLDTILCIWLQQAQAAGDRVQLQADDCLAFRGLKQQKSGSGARAGYEDKWRREVAAQIELLSRIAQPGQDARLIEAEPEDTYLWSVAPGPALVAAIFAHRRRTLLFSKRLLEYDPYRQKWEKRIGRLLCWQWAAGSEAATVEGLLGQLALPIDAKNPIRTKERLELALDTLQRDRVSGRWEYLNAHPEIIGKRGWIEHWLKWSLRIEAPPAQSAAFGDADTAPRPLASAERRRSYGFLKHIRAERGLSQAEVAAAIGLTQAQLSRIEAGGAVQAATAEKIKAWMLAEL